MNRRLARDLARWEAGEASLDDLTRRHPYADLAALTALPTRLSHLSDAPTPDPTVAWASVATRLTDREVAAPRSRRLRRPVVVAIAVAALAVPTVSYAGPDAVRSTWRKVTDLIPGVDDSPRSGDDGTAPAAVPNPVGDDGTTLDPHQPFAGTENSTDAHHDTTTEEPASADGASTTGVESDGAAPTSTTGVHADDGTPPPAGSTSTTGIDGSESPSTDG